MSISDKLLQLGAIRTNMRSALTDKGLTVSAHDLSDFASDISSIVRLPEEYQEVDYIESSGSQYILTHITLSGTDIVETKVQYKTTSENAFVWCSRVGTDTQSNSLCRVGNYFRNDYNNQKHNGATISTNTDYTITYDANKVYVNGSLTHTFTASDFTTVYPAILFTGYNPFGTINYYESIRMYYFRVKNSDGTVRADLIPCYRKADSVIGMYDIINNDFYTNEGTGDDFSCYPAVS